MMTVGYGGETLVVICMFAVVLVNVSGSRIENGEIEKRKPDFGTEVILSCGTQKIEITISEEYLAKNSDWILNISKLCLANRACCAQRVEGKFIITNDAPFSGCGNEISTLETITSNQSAVTHYKFTNKLIYDGGSGSIARDTLLLRFHCLYKADMLVTAQPSESDVSSRVIKIKKLQGDIELFRSPSFDERYQNSPSMQNDEHVYVKMKVVDPGYFRRKNLDVVSILKRCSMVDDRKIHHQIIEDGCPLHNKIEILSNGESLDSKFAFRMKELISKDTANATIRCLIDLCLVDSSNSCAPACSFRRKRFASKSSPAVSKINKQNYHEKYLLKFDGEEFSTTIFLSSSKEPSSTRQPTPSESTRHVSKSATSPISKNGIYNVTFEKEKFNNDVLLIYLVAGFILLFLLAGFMAALLLIFKRACSKS